MMLPLAGLLVASFLLSLIHIPMLKRFALSHGWVDRPSPRKSQDHPIPLSGGISIGLTFYLMLAGGLIVAVLHRRAGWFTFIPAGWEPYLGGIALKSQPLTIFCTGGLMILLVGLVDDRFGLSWKTRLFVELLVAIAVAVGVDSFTLFLKHAGPFGHILSVIVTVLWITGMMNAFNLFDHFDGLTAGASAAIGATLLALSILTGQYFIAALLAILTGALFAFLLFNLPPASLYLGDSGSLFIGYVLSVVTILFTFYETSRPLFTFFIPLVLFAVIWFDTAVVVIIRLRTHHPVVEGDTNHLAHRLRALGFSPRQTVMMIYSLLVFTSLSALLLYQVGLLAAIAIFVQVLLVLVIMTLVEFTGRKQIGEKTP